MTSARGSIAVAVFAHNEEHAILACLHSVRAALCQGDRCLVLVNGCTDRTGALVAAFCRNNPFCQLVRLELGDKAHAWNVFVHDAAPPADHYIFLDGDCTVLPQACGALADALRLHPRAHAAAALPADGVGAANRRQLRAQGGLAGNLYALSGGFVERLRQQQVRLPVGLIGDDSLVGALAYWDLDPRAEWDQARIVTVEQARFSYRPLSIWSRRDLRLYYRRKLRYSLRRLQIELLKPLLKQRGLAAIPADIGELYVNSRADVALRFSGLDFCFDYLAIKQARRYVNHGAGAALAARRRGTRGADS